MKSRILAWILVFALSIFMVSGVEYQQIEQDGYIIKAPKVISCLDCKIPVEITNLNNRNHTFELKTRTEAEDKVSVRTTYQFEKKKISDHQIIDKELIIDNPKDDQKKELQKTKYGKEEPVTKVELDDKNRLEIVEGLSLEDKSTQTYYLDMDVQPKQFVKYDIEIELDNGKIITLDPFVDTRYLIYEDNFDDDSINTTYWDVAGDSDYGDFNSFEADSRMALYIDGGGIPETISLRAIDSSLNDYYGQKLNISFQIMFNESDNGHPHIYEIFYKVGGTQYQIINLTDESDLNLYNYTLLFDDNREWVDVYNDTASESVYSHRVTLNDASSTGQLYWKFYIENAEGSEWVELNMYEYTMYAYEREYEGGLVAYYPFNDFDDNGTYNVTPEEANNVYNATITDEIINVTAVYDEGMEFHGEGSGEQGITIGKDGDFSDLCGDTGCSFEAYVNFNSTGGYAQEIIARADSSSYNYFFDLYLYSDDIYFKIFKNGTTGDKCKAILYNQVTANQWYHMVGLWDNEDMNCSLYLDGNYTTGDQMDWQVDTNEWFDNEDTFVGIRDDSSFHNPLNGTVDYVRIYDRAMFDWEIQDHYLYGENYTPQLFNLTILDEITNELVTDNITITYFNDVVEYRGTTDSGTFLSNPIPVGNITIRLIGDNYTARTFTAEINSQETTDLTVYLLPLSNSQQVKFSVRDVVTDTIENARIQIWKQDGVDFIPVTDGYTDIVGQMGVFLNIETLYRLKVSKTGYQERDGFYSVVTPYETTIILREDEDVPVMPLIGIYTTFSPTTYTLMASPHNTTFSYIVNDTADSLEYFKIYALFENGTNYTTNISDQSGGGILNLSMNLSEYANESLYVRYSVKSTCCPKYSEAYQYRIITYIDENGTAVGLMKGISGELSLAMKFGIVFVAILFVMVVFYVVGVPSQFLPFTAFLPIIYFTAVGWMHPAMGGIMVAMILGVSFLPFVTDK